MSSFFESVHGWSQATIRTNLTGGIVVLPAVVGTQIIIRRIWGAVSGVLTVNDSNDTRLLADISGNDNLDVPGLQLEVTPHLGVKFVGTDTTPELHIQYSRVQVLPQGGYDG